MLCERYELRDEAPAAGQWRGGLGAIKRWRMLQDIAISSTGDNRSGDPPRGLFGGHDGRPGSIVLRAADGDVQELPAKISNRQLRAGDRLEIRLVCGAGYGDPLRRDPSAVAGDVADGLLSSAQARDDYGVVLNAAGAVDEPATQDLRLRMSR